jgi:anti-sigma regulatory factor (Ser/Thr protein kinase)
MRRDFCARLHMLPDSAAFVEAFGRRHRIAGEDVVRLTLIVEELFTNTVAHGYRRECDLPIGITLGLREGKVFLIYEDAAPPYDPLAALEAARRHASAPPEARPVGRLGLNLIHRLAASSRYDRIDERNRLSLTLP